MGDVAQRAVGAAEAGADPVGQLATERTVGVWVAPMMGIPRMNPAEMLAQPMGGMAMGWAGHFLIGIILAVLYAALADRLRGPAWVRGATFAIAPFLMAQLVVLPMMGMPVFSGSVPMAMGSLIGHLVYGAIVGAIYGVGTQVPA